MAGKKGHSGARAKAGQVYQFTFYYRYVPGRDPQKLKTLLDALVAARGRKRQDILRAALLGGAEQGQDTAAQIEDSDDAALLDAMFDNF